MESLPDVFERIARDILAEQPIGHRWEARTKRKRELVSPKQCEGGFEVRVNNGPYAEETGLLLFKFWGARSVQTFQNTALPPRYHR